MLPPSAIWSQVITTAGAMLPHMYTAKLNTTCASTQPVSGAEIGSRSKVGASFLTTMDHSLSGQSFLTQWITASAIEAFSQQRITAIAIKAYLGVRVGEGVQQ